MKVLVIMGSPRKGNTYHAVQQIEEQVRAMGDVEFEYLMLRDLDLLDCRGCYVCFEKGEEHCPLKDEGRAIEQRMHDADAVIFATPVYGMNVSGLFKTFVDRFSYIFHRPRFFDKKALLLTTAGALGMKEVLDYLDLVARVWGFEIVGRIGLVTPPLELPLWRVQENEEKVHKAARAFHRALHSEARSPPRLKDVILFHSQRGSFDEIGERSPVDYEYWKESGWLDPGALYFVDVPVNPIFHGIGMIVEWLVRRQIRKELVSR